MTPQQKHTVLVVDDEETVLNLIHRQLSELDYTIIPTPSAAEAIHLLNTREIAMLICDLDLPDISGNVVLTSALRANPDIVSVLLSGKADRAAIVRALNEGGIWKFIGKPWKKDELLSIVEEGVTRYVRLRKTSTRLRSIAHEVTSRRRLRRPDRRGKKPIVVVKKQRAPSRRSRQKQNLQNIRIKGKSTAPESARYRFIELLGRGRAGEVYRAEDSMLDMLVAVKVLSRRYLSSDAEINILKEEARIAMQLSHQHIVRLHNLQKAGDRYLLVMEYVDGCTLRETIAAYGLLTPESVLQIVSVASGALAYAHRHNVLHKDLKPSNIMLTDDGVLKIIDFGIACLKHKQGDNRYVMGTPGYMSPEQIRGRKVDERSDIYSLATVVFELLTGAPPIPADTSPEDVLASLPIDVSPLPTDIADVVARALAPQPDDRWPSVPAFESALLAAAQHPPADRAPAGDNDHSPSPAPDSPSR